MIRLCDAYAGLLTARQQQQLRMYYQDDFSLGEIAESLRVTRQAVFDSLRRAVGEMRHLEDRLGVLAAAATNGRARPVRGRRAASENRRDDVVARLSRVEREAARLARAGAATGALLHAIRALREAMLGS